MKKFSMMAFYALLILFASDGYALGSTVLIYTPSIKSRESFYVANRFSPSVFPRNSLDGRYFWLNMLNGGALVNSNGTVSDTSADTTRYDISCGSKQDRMFGLSLAYLCAPKNGRYRADWVPNGLNGTPDSNTYWPALARDVGNPINDNLYVFQNGTSYSQHLSVIAGSPPVFTPQPYIIYARYYTKALILVRSRYGEQFSQMADTCDSVSQSVIPADAYQAPQTEVAVNLGSDGQTLGYDNTLGISASSFVMRNGSGAIVLGAFTPLACSVSPTSINYGSVTTGTNSDVSVTITNIGAGRLTGVISLSDSTNFSIQGITRTYDLVPSGLSSKIFTIRFTPRSAGAKTCTAATGGACASIALTGTGVSPVQCSVSPAAIAFDTTLVGSVKDKILTITNTGGGSLVGTVTISSGSFTLRGPTQNYTLIGGASFVDTIRFTPSGAGLVASIVNTGASCSGVTLTGVGRTAALCSVSPTSLDYGLVLVGSPGASHVVNLTNVGGQLMSGVVTLSDTSNYSIVPYSPNYSLSNSSKNFVIRFTPRSAGTKVDTLIVGSGCSRVPLTGIGFLSPACSLSVKMVTFDTTIVGDSSTKTFTIKNIGGGNLKGVVSSTYPFVKVIGTAIYSLGAAASQTFTVRFTPTTATTYSCAISSGTTGCTSLLATGVGVLPANCSLTTTSVDFGSVRLHSTKQYQINITNTGGQNLNGVAFISDSINYTLRSVTYAANPIYQFVFDFAPKSLGTKNTTLHLGGLCGDVSVTGVGIAQRVNAPVVIWTSPSVGEVWLLGTSHKLTWIVVDADGSGDIKTSGGLIEYSANGISGPWIPITVTLNPTLGTYTYNFSSPIIGITNNARLRMLAQDNEGNGMYYYTSPIRIVSPQDIPGSKKSWFLRLFGWVFGWN